MQKRLSYGTSKVYCMLLLKKSQMNDNTLFALQSYVCMSALNLNCKFIAMQNLCLIYD